MVNFFKGLKHFFSGLTARQRSRQAKGTIRQQDNLDKKLVFSLTKARIPSWPQFKYLAEVLSPKEKRVIRFLVSLAVVALLVLGVRVYYWATKVVVQPGGEYREALVGSPKYLNPILAQTNDPDMDLSRLIFSGLLKYNNKLELVSDLARDYKISEDQKTYTFYLKDNVKWHDGEKFSADDILFTIASIQDPEYKSPLYKSFKGVKVEKIDELTVSFTLKEPFAPFLSSLTVGILPEHLWGNVPAANANLTEYNLKPIGTGPYEFKQLTKDKFGNIKSYVLEADGDYYFHPPFIKTMIFKFYAESEEAITAARKGNVDGVSYVPGNLKEELNKNKNIQYHSFQLPQYSAIFLNQQNELLKIKEVKQALAYAVDKQKIIDEVLKKNGERIDGPILPGFVGHYGEIKKYDYDPVQAEKILEEKGWVKDAETGLRKKGNKELRFSLTTIDQPEYLEVADFLKDFWQAVGFGVELRIIDSSRIQNYVIKPRSYEALLFGEIVGSDPDPYPFWHSSQIKDPGLNLSVYANKDVDKLLEAARKTSNNQERTQKYTEFQKILAEDLPAIFLYNPVYTYATVKQVKGITLERISIPSDRFIGAEDWYLKTRRAWK